MKKFYLFLGSLTIMIVCLGLMAANWLIVPLPDWAVRSAGLILLADLPVLVYLRIRFNRSINKKGSA